MKRNNLNKRINTHKQTKHRRERKNRYEEAKQNRNLEFDSTKFYAVSYSIANKVSRTFAFLLLQSLI